MTQCKEMSEQEINSLLSSPERIAQELREFNAWRRGEGKYAWNEDPSKNLDYQLPPRVLGLVIDKAADLLSQT